MPGRRAPVSPPHPDLPASIRNEDLVDFLLTRFDEDEETAQFVALSASRSTASLVVHVLRDVRAERDLVRYFRDLEQQVRAVPRWSGRCG